MRQSHLLLVELSLILIATVLALVLRDNLEVSAERLIDLAPYMLCTLSSAIVIRPTLGTSRSIWRFTTMTDYLRIYVATIALVIGALMLNRMAGVARALPMIQALLILFCLVGARVLMRLPHPLHERPSAAFHEGADGCKTVLIVGLGDLATLYSRSVSRLAPRPARIAGILSDDDCRTGRSCHGHPILGTPEQVAKALRVLEVDGVFLDCIIVAMPYEHLSSRARSELLKIEKLSDISLEFLVDQMVLRLSSAEGAATAGGSSHEVAALSFDASELAALKRRPFWRVKRAIDVIGASSIMSPLALFAAILAAIDVGRPVTFLHQRPGLEGRPFKLYKLRTMAKDYDAHGHRVPDELRTSPIGGFMKRMRLDELPQLFNILCGERSFVGSRPLLPVDQPAAYSARLSRASPA